MIQEIKLDDYHETFIIYNTLSYRLIITRTRYYLHGIIKDVYRDARAINTARVNGREARRSAGRARGARGARL